MRKKKMDKKVLMGGFIAFIMITSVFGVLFYGFNAPSDERINEYKGRIFKFRNNGFVSEFNGEEIFFTVFPKEVENIPMDEKAKNLLNQDYFVITYNPESELASEMAFAQFKLFEERLKPLKKNVVRALTHTAGSVLEKKTCDDATEKNPVILLEYGNETSISVIDNCIIAKANSASDVYKISDRIVYSMLGVMQ